MTSTQRNDIAGAIFDFAGFLTIHKEVIAVGSTASASPMVSRIQEWAEARGLSLESANVMTWNEELAEPAPEPVAWQPIETAPMDGSQIVVKGSNYGDESLGRHHCIACWYGGAWMEASDWNATSELKYLTHWAPLPADGAAPVREPVPEPAAEIYAPSYLPRAIGLRFTHYGTTLPAGTKLYAAPVREPAPVQEPVAQTDEALREVFAQCLTSTYVCGRAWSAWGVGTMSESDFSPASECDELLNELVNTHKTINAPQVAPVREILGSDTGAEDKCPTCGSDCNERDELIKAERHIERLQRALRTALKAASMCVNPIENQNVLLVEQQNDQNHN